MNGLSKEAYKLCREAKSVISLMDKMESEFVKNYVEHAMKAGEILTRLKSGIPHGSWEQVCVTHLGKSLSTVKVYMRLYSDLSALPNRQRTAVLALEDTLSGASKAARKLVKAKQNMGVGEGENVPSSLADASPRESRTSDKDTSSTTEIPADAAGTEEATECVGGPNMGGGSGEAVFPPPPQSGTTPAFDSRNGKSDAAGGDGVSASSSPVFDHCIECPTCHGKGRIPESESPGTFEDFWSVVCRVACDESGKRLAKSKGQARKAYNAAVKRLATEYADPHGFLRVQIELYGNSGEGQGAYCVQASTWLNGERYLEDPDQWRDGTSDRRTMAYVPGAEGDL